LSDIIFGGSWLKFEQSQFESLICGIFKAD